MNTKKYKIYWESNSRVKGLLSERKIEPEQIHKRRTTANFEADAATVRIQRLTNKHPVVTVHIKGTPYQHTYAYGGGSFTNSPVLRVTFGGDWQGNQSDMITFNGYLDGASPPLSDVHEIVNSIKETLEV
jgi:hypothetical protein